VRESTHRSSTDLRAWRGQSNRDGTHQSSTTGEDARCPKTPFWPRRHLLDAAGWKPTRT
jgi:hypothetical protein